MPSRRVAGMPSAAVAANAEYADRRPAPGQLKNGMPHANASADHPQRIISAVVTMPMPSPSARLTNSGINAKPI